MYVINDALMVFGGAAIPVQRLTTPLANWLHCELVIGRETSLSGEKRYGCGSPAVSNSSMSRSLRRYGVIIVEMVVIVGP
jgi:hypothetical protein